MLGEGIARERYEMEVREKAQEKVEIEILLNPFTPDSLKSKIDKVSKITNNIEKQTALQ